MIDIKQIKDLRDRTGISIAQCKQALEDTNGDMDKALDILKSKGAEIAGKKSGRSLRSGTISAYVHGGGVLAAMVKLACETDFVSKNKEFKDLAFDLAMQAVANGTDINDFLKQPFIKDPSLTIDDLLKSFVQKFGERVEILEIVRLDLSEEKG